MCRSHRTMCILRRIIIHNFTHVHLRVRQRNTYYTLSNRQLLLSLMLKEAILNLICLEKERKAKEKMDEMCEE